MGSKVAERTSVDPAMALGRRLETRYRQIHGSAMAGVPICNPALGVAATGFQSYGGRAFGIMTTPWFMNLVAVDLPDGKPAVPADIGTTLCFGLPAGEAEFTAGELDAIGRINSCSLFSPVFEFVTMEAALETAEEIVRAFFDPATMEPPTVKPTPVNRRDLLSGRFRRREEASE
ncbi:[NiFe]-hydrogenase assembly chaperone HybE [Rhizobium etli]|uniref:[NiFe]-hydrogenase assembly chaperone HybE n=1 Tax=Rhizobium etli TaxID=29449 RepID=UPI0003839060|nr:[NiFe]-hydrogenase assembly chaperone HybE [Rhizobium etli]AGS25259.1 hydrogenase expression/formation protein HupJ [Rhizobium etli bv. mimosae str. Mim1]